MPDRAPPTWLQCGCPAASFLGYSFVPRNADRYRSEPPAVDDQAVDRKRIEREDRQRPERYAGMIRSCAIEFKPSANTPPQRAGWFLAKTPKPTRIWTTPRMRTTQPQVFRWPNTYWAFPM